MRIPLSLRFVVATLMALSRFLRPSQGQPHFGEYEYVFFSRLATWYEAESHCASLGGQLAVPTTEEQLFKTADLANMETWIGCMKPASNDTAAEDIPLIYTPTQEPVPSERGYQCQCASSVSAPACMYQYNNAWDAHDCNEKLFFICQFPWWQKCGDHEYTLLRTLTSSFDTAKRVCNTHRGVLTRTLPDGCELGDYTTSALAFNESEFSGEQHGFICQRERSVASLTCNGRNYLQPEVSLPKDQARIFCRSYGASLADDDNCTQQIVGDKRHWINQETQSMGNCSVFEPGQGNPPYGTEFCTTNETFVCQKEVPAQGISYSKCGLYQYGLNGNNKTVSWDKVNENCNRVGGWLATPQTNSERRCFENLTKVAGSAWTGFADNSPLTYSDPFSSQPTATASAWWPPSHLTIPDSVDESCWLGSYNNNSDTVEYYNLSCTEETQSAQVCQSLTWVGCGNLQHHTEYAILSRLMNYDDALESCIEIGATLALEPPQGECLVKLRVSLSNGMPETYWRGPAFETEPPALDDDCPFHSGHVYGYRSCAEELPALCERHQRNPCKGCCSGCDADMANSTKCRRGCTTPDSPCSPCPANWVYECGRCYYFGGDTLQVSWETAKDFCSSRVQGGHLLEIDSQRELGWILSHIRNSRGPHQSGWVGLTNHSGSLTWANSGISYSETGAELPLGNTGTMSNCARLISPSPPGMASYELTVCEENHMLICEMELASCPPGQYFDGIECRNCTCEANRSTGCNPCTGTCICKTGYTRRACDHCLPGIIEGCQVTTVHPLGCYNASILHQHFPVEKRIACLQPQRCQMVCRQSGYRFAALRYGFKCYCGQAFEPYPAALLNDSLCNAPCTGDSNQVCGGATSSNILATDLAGSFCGASRCTVIS